MISHIPIITVPVQTLAKPAATSSVEPGSQEAVGTDFHSELAHTLQPLLEQEAMLENYLAEANNLRKFEDARSLQTSLDELRVEIELISKRAL